jgi:ribosomal protein L16 Arg81 hydroxylase
MITPIESNDARALDSIVERMLGRQPDFFREYWRRKPLYSPAADPGHTIRYGVEQFLADLTSTERPPYGAVKARDGRRFDSFHESVRELIGAISEGSVCAVKLSRHWNKAVPASWQQMRSLYARLCRSVAMIYLSRVRSEDVDLFLAGPESCLGTHFDTTDVFTLQLCGERKWIVEKEFSLDGILRVGRDPSWYPTREIDFPGDTREITLQAGDALYVPAYTVHRVVGAAWSVSLSLGLRAYNEIDVIEHLLQQVRMSDYLKHAPFPGMPESLGEEHIESKLELMRRMRVLLRDLEGLAVAYLASPLQLPPHLNQTQQSGPDDEGTASRADFTETSHPQP